MPITQSFVVLTLPRMKLVLGCFIDVVIFRVICVETKDENLKTALIMDYIATLTDKSSIREKDFVFNKTFQIVTIFIGKGCTILRRCMIFLFSLPFSFFWALTFLSARRIKVKFHYGVIIYSSPSCSASVDCVQLNANKPLALDTSWRRLQSTEIQDVNID